MPYGASPFTSYRIAHVQTLSQSNPIRLMHKASVLCLCAARCVGSFEFSFGCNCWTVASVEEWILLTHLDKVSTCSSKTQQQKLTSNVLRLVPVELTKFVLAQGQSIVCGAPGQSSERRLPFPGASFPNWRFWATHGQGRSASLQTPIDL